MKLRFFLSALAVWFVAAIAALAADVICTLDHCDRPLPGNPPAGWWFNNTGGPRYTLLDIASDPNGTARYSQATSGTAYRVQIERLIGSALWTFAGIGESLGHPLSDKHGLRPSALFHPLIKAAYQPQLVGFEVVVNRIESPAGRSDLQIRSEFRGFDSAGNEVLRQAYTWSGRTNLLAYSYPCTFRIAIDPTSLDTLTHIALVLDRARPGDAIEFDAIRLIVRSPDLDPATEMFVWSLANELDNIDPATHLVNDRGCFATGQMINLSASGKCAKLLALAIARGVVDPAAASTEICAMASSILNIPTGPGGLKPHFVNASLQRLAGSEWGCADDVIAHTDLAVALKMIGDPANQLPAVLAHIKAIDWAAMRAADGSMHHGFDSSGNLIPSTWYGFGVERYVTLLGELAAGSPCGTMAPAPGDWGQCFETLSAFPIPLSGVDRWGNNWTAQKAVSADTQISWYSQPSTSNRFFSEAGLFGLVPAEIPAGWSISGDNYAAYGVGGRTRGPLDGNHSVVVPTATLLVSPLRPEAAARMWASLKSMGLVTPLTWVESLGIDPTSGVRTANYLRGSWNLALAAENAAIADTNTTKALCSAFQAIPEFAAAQAVLFPSAAPQATTNFFVIYADSADLFAKPAAPAGQEFQISSTNTMNCRFLNHPACVDANYIYFDAIDFTPGERQRYGIWRISLTNRRIAERRTSDPWGNSSDSYPCVSPLQSGLLYRSNRTGMNRMQYAPTGQQGPGYGNWGGGGYYAAWSTLTNEAYKAYIAPAGISSNCTRMIYDCVSGSAAVETNINWSSGGSMKLACTRLDMSRDGRFLVISTTNGVYLKPLANGDARQILPFPANEACISPDSRHVAYVQVPAGATNSQIYVADLDASGAVTNTARLTFSSRQYSHPAWVALDATADVDSDGLSAAAEFQAGTSASNPDSDGDGVKDGDETPGGKIQFSVSSCTTPENGGLVTLTVQRVGDSSGVVTVQYATAAGTANAGSDYTTVSGTLTWSSGDMAPKSFAVQIPDDTVFEATESFSVILSGVSGATLGSPSSASVTIQDDDPAMSATPATLDFGVLQAGFVADGYITVKNTGNGLLVGSASVPAPFTIVSGVAYSLAAGQGQTITVRYAPLVAGAHSCTLFLSGGGNGTVTVYGQAYSGQVAQPRFSPAGGEYTAPVDVVVSCATAGATIRYTTDGSEPAASSPSIVNGGSVRLSATGVLKAKAGKSGWIDSLVTSSSYIIRDPSVVILSPTNSAAGCTINVSISAWAQASAGLLEVRFRDGTTVIGTASNVQVGVSTWSNIFTWASTTPGVHYLTAEAIDIRGCVATSPVVVVQLAAPLLSANVYAQLPTGQVYSWTINTDGSRKVTSSLYNAATAWRLCSAGDLNGDGTADLIWQLPSGQVACWYMNPNGTAKASSLVYFGTTTWQVRGAGDIDKDGITDLVWQVPTGQVAVWFMNANGTVKSSKVIYPWATTWLIRAAGDINDDGIADLVWQLPTGQVAAWYLNADATMKSGVNIYSGATPWQIRATADINKDGTADLLWQDSAGQVACWFLDETGSLRSTAFLQKGACAAAVQAAW